jgi:hypothetical protein
MPGPLPRYSEEARAAIAACIRTPRRCVGSGCARAATVGTCSAGTSRSIRLIPVDHFDRNARKGGGSAIPLEEIMVEHSSYSNRGNLKRKLFATRPEDAHVRALRPR